MTYKAVLFDLDGTLLNTIDDIGDAINRVLEQNRFPTHNMDTYRRLVGNGALNTIIGALPEDKRVDTVITSCLKAFQEDYSRNWNVKTKAYDGIPELLSSLTDRKVKITVLSNKPHKYTKQCMEGFLPDWDFDVVFGQRDDVPRKPDPAGALEIAEKLNLSPSDFLYLGDTDVDMKTSVGAGMFPVGVLWGLRSAEELKEYSIKVMSILPYRGF